MSATLTQAHSRTDAENFFLASRFLAHEARLLDERRFDEWFELIDDEIVYEVPLVVARLQLQDETAGGGHRICDNKARLKVRIDRLNCGQAWSETPPSRTVRVVGSVLATSTAQEDVLEVDSTLLLYRQRADNTPGDILPVRRYDLLRLSDEIRLLKRRAIIPDTVLRTPNMGVFV